MSALRLIDTDVVDADVLAGPETFEAPMITVVDGLKIEPQSPQAIPIEDIHTFQGTNVLCLNSTSVHA